MKKTETWTVFVTAVFNSCSLQSQAAGTLAAWSLYIGLDWWVLVDPLRPESKVARWRSHNTEFISPSSLSQCICLFPFPLGEGWRVVLNHLSWLHSYLGQPNPLLGRKGRCWISLFLWHGIACSAVFTFTDWHWCNKDIMNTCHFLFDALSLLQRWFSQALSFSLSSSEIPPLLWVLRNQFRPALMIWHIWTDPEETLK